MERSTHGLAAASAEFDTLTIGASLLNSSNGVETAPATIRREKRSGPLKKKNESGPFALILAWINGE